MGISTKEISDVIKERLKDFDASLVSADVGRIVAVGDGIAQIYGLQNAMAGEMLGRIVNPLGAPLDDKGPIKTSKTLPLERIAPGVITRKRVDSPVQTGMKAIRALIP